jgi:hypothetical protein
VVGLLGAALGCDALERAGADGAGGAIEVPGVGSTCRAVRGAAARRCAAAAGRCTAAARRCVAGVTARATLAARVEEAALVRLAGLAVSEPDAGFCWTALTISTAVSTNTATNPASTTARPT